MASGVLSIQLIFIKHCCAGRRAMRFEEVNSSFCQTDMDWMNRVRTLKRRRPLENYAGCKIQERFTELIQKMSGKAGIKGS